MKIIAVGWNYRAHNAEMDDKKAPFPVIFTKPETAVLRPGRPFFIPAFTDRVEYECELIVRICRLGRNIAEKFASRYYCEIGLGLDLTARDLQQKLRAEGSPWEICKGFDNSAPISEFYPLEKFGGRVQDIHFRLELNGRTVQEASSADMIFTVDRIIAEASRYFTLKTGDIIFTGTPSGVGKIDIGDVLTGYIENEKVLELNIK